MISSDPAAPPAPPLAAGGVITGVVVFAVVAWIVAATVLKLPSYGAALLVFWYWTTTGRTDFRTLTPALVGAVVGVGIIWALRGLLPLGAVGLAVAVALFAAAILADVMRWIPWAVNGCTLLFTTVIGIPAIMGGTNFAELLATLALGSGWFFLVAFIATRFAPAPEI